MTTKTVMRILFEKVTGRSYTGLWKKRRYKELRVINDLIIGAGPLRWPCHNESINQLLRCVCFHTPSQNSDFTFGRLHHISKFHLMTEWIHASAVTLCIFLKNPQSSVSMNWMYLSPCCMHTNQFIVCWLVTISLWCILHPPSVNANL